METGNLILTVENTTTGLIEDHEVEMVVLSVGVIPRQDGDLCTFNHDSIDPVLGWSLGD